MPSASAASSTVSPAKWRSSTTSAASGSSGREPGQGVVEGEQIVVAGRGGDARSASRSTRWRSPPCLTALLAAGRSTRMRRMASAAAAKKWPRPSNAAGRADQAQVRLVDQGGGVERVAGRLGGHARGGELAQLVVDERQQLGGGLAVARLGGVEEASHVGHGGAHF